MRRWIRVLSAAVLAGPFLGPGSAEAQTVRASDTNTGQVADARGARAGRGAISGIVSDERGGPLAGAMVSALGQTMAMAVTDKDGRFLMESLPAGDYTLRVHLSGFAASTRELARVAAARPSVHRFQLRRLDGSVGTTGAVEAKPPTILTAGLAAPPVESPETDATGTKAGGDHPHNEVAFRLRHIKRSILKDVGPIAVPTDEPVDLPSPSLFGRAMYSAGNLAASLFSGLPLYGEVNVLTTSAFAPGGLWSGATLPRGVAYLQIGAPTSAGDWSVRAAMSQGDVASWVVAGSFVSRQAASHAYRVGLSYATQGYQGGNPAALAALTDGSRNVGEVYGFDRWSVSRAVAVEYGGRYTRYDYLDERGLLSPRLGVTVEPLKGTRVVANVAQRMVAPGAEEFLSRGVTGPWLPPERTFAPLWGRELQVERARSLDVALEQDLAGAFVVSVRRFRHDVDDQLVTLFDVNFPEGHRSLGHYYVTNAGAVEAGGWGLRFSSPETKRVRAAIDYSITQARWTSRGDTAALTAWAPGALRADDEDIHDITTTVQTEIPETATRVFVLYRVNSAYTRANADPRPGLDGRFDVQVNQALPFALGGTQWEVLLGMRNLFRDPNDRASVYDELLVVRPPKRVVGGFLVKF